MRVDIKAILKNPAQRRELMVQTIIATQAREGVTTTRAQAEAAYDAVKKECAMPKTKKPTETQFVVLRQMALFELPLVRRPGGFWCLADDVNDTGLRAHRKGEWSVPNGTQVVRALERAGWVQRTHLDERAWCDPRELTEAGRAVWPSNYQGT